MTDELAFAVAAARAAGSSTLRWFGRDGLVVETKDNDSPVTAADREAETILRGEIRAAWPDDGIVGEEGGETPGSSGRRWILDPIDGTKSFVRGVPLYGTLVALEDAGRAVLGVIVLPALGEMVYAARGAGATWVTGIGGAETSRPARVSTVDAFDRALLCGTSPRAFSGATRPLAERVRLQRGWGDCYGHVLVATGRAEVMVDPRMAIWDCAALQPVVEEAGGAFFDLRGAATHAGGSAVSTNAALAGAVRDLLIPA